MKVERSRLALLAGGTAFLVLRALRLEAVAAPGLRPEVTVYKSPTCGCCTEWVAHLRRHGFRVKTEDVPDLQGHVPADLIERLLRERPRVVGLAVPGMPVGAPGMEVPGRPADRYQVIAFDRSGKTGVFATR